MHTRLLFILIISILLSLSIYTLQTRQYPQWDEHHYLSIAVKTLDAVNKKGITGFFDIIPISGSRQPVYPLVLTIILILLGTEYTYKIALILNAIFFVFTILGTYILAKRFFSTNTSFFVAVLAGTYGNALFYAHFTYVETAVTTAIVWSMVAIIKTEQFSNRKWTLFAGILTAIATLTRFIAPVYLAGPILVELFHSVYTSRKTIPNIILFLFLSIALPLSFYFIPNHEHFLEYVYNNQTYGKEWVAQYRDPAMANTFSVRSIMYYFNIIQQNTIVPFLLFVTGFLLILFSLGQHFGKKSSQIPLFSIFYLLLSFFIPYVFLTFITIWKEDRFLVSLYPVVALISGVFLERLQKFRLTFIIVILFIIFITSINFVAALFGFGPAGKKGLIDYITPRWVPHPRRIYLTPLVWPPTKEYAHADMFVHSIEADWKGTDKAHIGLAFSHEPFINALSSIFQYEKRNLAILHLNKTAEDFELDYLATSPELEETTQWKKLATIIIPYDNSRIYLYKKMY